MRKTFETIINESLSEIFSFLNDSLIESDIKKVEPEEANNDHVANQLDKNIDNSIFFDLEPCQSAETYVFDDNISFSQDVIINKDDTTKEEMIVKTIDGELWNNTETVSVQKTYIDRLKHRIFELEEKLEKSSLANRNITKTADLSDSTTQEKINNKKHDQIECENIFKSISPGMDESDIQEEETENEFIHSITFEQDGDLNIDVLQNNVYLSEKPRVNETENHQSPQMDSTFVHIKNGTMIENMNSPKDYNIDRVAEAIIVKNSFKYKNHGLDRNNSFSKHLDLMNLDPRSILQMESNENVKENRQEHSGNVNLVKGRPSSLQMYNESFYSSQEDKIGPISNSSLIERRLYTSSFSETNRLLCALKEKDSLICDLNNRIENMNNEKEKLEVTLDILEKDLIRSNENKEMYIHLASQEIESLKNAMEVLRDQLEFERSKNYKIRSNLFDTRKKCIEMVEAVEFLTQNY